MGNTPITNNYYDKVDRLKKIGLIQGFWSINPNPIDTDENIKATKEKGFYRFDEFAELTQLHLPVICKRQITHTYRYRFFYEIIFLTYNVGGYL